MFRLRRRGQGPSAMKDMPFDGKRMIFGGFDVLVDIGRE